MSLARGLWCGHITGKYFTCNEAAMSSVQYLKEFINQRLTAAAEEIFGVLEKTIVEYEDVVDRQRKLLDIVLKPEIKLHRTGFKQQETVNLPQQQVYDDEEVLTDQQLCNQDRNSSLDHEDPEPLLIKEEQEEICSSQEGEQVILKQEIDTFMLTPGYEETDHSEPEPGSDHQLLSHNSPVAESQDQRGSKHEESGSTRNAEPKPQKRQNRNRSHSDNVYNSPMSKIHSNTHRGTKSLKCDTCGKDFKYNWLLKRHLTTHADLPQQHVCQEEEVLTDQQLCNQERNSSLDQEDPEPPQIEEEQEEICSSQEGEQLVLKQDTDTFMLTSDHEETDHSEPEPGSDHQLLSHNSPVAESQDQRGSKHEDSGSTRNTEPKPQKIDFKKTAEEISGVNTIVEYEEEVDRQHRLLDIIWKPEIKLHRIDLPQQHVCMEEEVLTDQQLCNQERNSSLDQEDPEPLLIKEEQEEICSSQEGEQLVLKQETDTFMLTSDDEETDHSEPEPGSDHQLLSHSSPVAESQDQRGSKHEDSGSTRNAEPTPQKRQNGNSGHSDKAFKQKHPLKRHLKTHMDLPQQHVCKEEEVLTDQQLCNQERNSSLDQEDPEPLQIKEEQEEICSSQEGEQLVLKQETDTFI
ncbi:putative mediator of RNA polymerase II transcription subunit 26 [Lates calcarifer]|uniref:Mediator of RNA polymerase II transcription subunit 26 n=1 Tax=Lates calcarifer TaxID=8187 RepID=A0AAJ8B7V0_LATCA|nr:putative mediator of RNA polymerase II transcription subunit 26 [Lates calcarifer]